MVLFGNRINSVPTFIIEDQYEVVGAQPEEVFRKVFEELKTVKGEESSNCESGACRFN